MACGNNEAFDCFVNHYIEAIIMKKRALLFTVNGTSMMELVIALFISSIVITGVFRIARSVFVSADREKQKAEMLRDIMTVSNVIERDIRMAGCGLPGNGMRATINPGQNDYLMMFANEQRLQSTLTGSATWSTDELYVTDATGFREDDWVCLEGTDTIYREIQSITLYSSNPDIIKLSTPVGVAVNFPVGTKIYAASRIVYEVVSNPEPMLRRKKNDMTIELGAKLQKISVIPKKASGNVVLLARDADVLTVVLGGYIGKDGNRFLLADSTEVNVRN